MRGLSGRAVTLLAAIIYGCLAVGPTPLLAAANTSTVAGTVHGTDGAPVAGARVTLIGAQRLMQTTDSTGAFKFADVPTGLYTMLVSKGGYETYRNDNVAAFIGETVTVNVTMSPSSFSSLRTIASVSTTTPGTAAINTSSAAINSISSLAFQNQGSQQVTKVLNETPGILTTPYNPNNGNPSNGASPASEQTPQIRGALPYETESLIDGHPVSVGSAGTFSPTLVNPFLLEDAELVKGPGSMPTAINYAINGTVNYRTLEPTAVPHSSGFFGVDGYGGISTGFKATGSTTNHKIGYALGYTTDGAPGPLQSQTFHGSQLPLDNGPPGGPYFVNGQQVAMVGAPVGEGLGPTAFSPYSGMGLVFNEPLYGCCYTNSTGYHSTAELGKIVYNFSNSTSLKLSYLGGQSVNGNGDVEAYDTSLVANTGLPAFSFAPCGSANQAITCNPFASGASYNCASPGSSPNCGTAIPFDLSSFNGVGNSWQQQNLFQGEFRTALGQSGTVLARYYTGSLNTYAVEGPSTPLNVDLHNVYGTIPLCPSGTTYDPAPPPILGGTDPNGLMCLTSANAPVSPVNTTFNGQSANFTTASQANLVDSNDTMNGESLEVQEQLGENTLTFSYDRNEQSSSSSTDEPSVGIIVLSPVAGSKQIFQTYSVRGNFFLGPKLNVNVADYFVDYLSHYSIDGGKTFNDSTHTYNEPRAALTWHPNGDTAYRFSAGGSVAPPYISLISSGGPTWSAIIGGVPAAGWVRNGNSGNVNAETAFGYDLGMDRRIERSTSVSLDFYFTQLHNLFLTQTGTVTFGTPEASGCPNAPCEISLTENLGQARYEGIELAVNHVVPHGFGWKLQGSFQRAFTYDLPQDFYCLVAGPGCTYNTNLAVLPNVNFGGVATAISGAPNGIASGRVPYASGYGELNWTGRYGQYYNLGLTYFGNNNSYNEPPFAVLSANVRFDLNDRGTKLQISGDNLTGAYPNPYVGFFNGIPLPLVNGATQASLTNPGTYVPVGFAAAPAGNYGPATVRVIFSQDF